MTNNFDTEIIGLDNSKYIYDKSRIIYVYTEFYKEIVSALTFGYIRLVPEFKKYLTLIFIETIDMFESKKESVNCVEFFNYFFNSITDTYFFEDCLPAVTVIKNYLSMVDDTKESYCFDIPYVDILDTINMNFYTKARVLLILIEYFNNFIYNFNSLYRTEISANRVMNEIVDKLLSLIPNIMSNSDGFDSFKINLGKETYTLLSNIIGPDKPPFRYFSDYRMNNVVNSLSDYEKEIFWSLILSCLSGYEREIGDNKNGLEKIKYNVKRLSISKKINYLGYKVC